MMRYWLIYDGTGLVKGFYACIYIEKVEIWSGVTIAGQTHEQTNKER